MEDNYSYISNTCSKLIIDDGRIDNTIKNVKNVLLFPKTSENAGTISMAKNNFYLLSE